MIMRTYVVRLCLFSRLVARPRCAWRIADRHFETTSMRVRVERRTENAVWHWRTTNRI
jgi:hypothetical protein